MHGQALILFLDDYEHLFAHSPDVMAFSSRARLEVHTEPLRGEALSQALHRADGLVLMRDRTPIGKPELAMAPHLKFVIYTGLRNALLDEAACKARNIPVFNTEFGPTKASTCELTWALILAATKRLEPGFLALRKADSSWRAGCISQAFARCWRVKPLASLGWDKLVLGWPRWPSLWHEGGRLEPKHDTRPRGRAWGQQRVTR